VCTSTTTQRRSPGFLAGFWLTVRHNTQVLLVLPRRQAAHVRARVRRPGTPARKALALHHNVVRVLRRQGRQPVLLCFLVLPVRSGPRRGHAAGESEIDAVQQFCAEFRTNRENNSEIHAENGLDNAKVAVRDGVRGNWALQERPCDFLDCLSSWGPYELRKTVQAKYGLHDPRDDCGDACCAIFCGCCMVCQDYKELKLRQGQGTAEVQNLLTGASSSAISRADDDPVYPPADYPAYPTAPKM
jgi:hypothetical protein